MWTGMGWDGRSEEGGGGEGGRSSAVIWEKDVGEGEKAELSGILPSGSALRYTN